jgi:hypothetical protein
VTYRKEYADLPELIADCIVGPDRSVLVVKALNSPNRLTLRELLGAARGKKLSEGPPESVVSRLGAEEHVKRHPDLTLSRHEELTPSMV